LGSSTATADGTAVFVVTGPSGAGKGTLIKALLERVPALEVAISATTRLQRRGEEDGREYWFLTDAEFVRRVDRGEFLEHVTYVSGKRYGTLWAEIDRIATAGRIPVLELETEGALTVKEQNPRAVTVFIIAPIAELERRLRERASESEGEIGERIGLARNQLEQANEFDYVVLNDDVERATDELEGIVQREVAAAATMSRP
jgi:guanylate kinase